MCAGCRRGGMGCVWYRCAVELGLERGNRRKTCRGHIEGAAVASRGSNWVEGCSLLRHDSIWLLCYCCPPSPLPHQVILRVTAAAVVQVLSAAVTYAALLSSPLRLVTALPLSPLPHYVLLRVGAAAAVQALGCVRVGRC